MSSRVVVILACLGLTVSPALGTAQRGDILVLDDEQHRIQTNPLEPFLKANPDMRPEPKIVSSSLWRRYIATWAIDEGRLFLIDVSALRQTPGVADFETELHSVMAALFPEQQRVFAEWFTGHIVVVRGDLVEYVHLDYASTFDDYSVLTVREGVVTDDRRMGVKQFRRFRKRQFRAYQQTDQYRSSFDKFKDPDETTKEVEDFIFRVSAGRYMTILFDDAP